MEQSMTTVENTPISEESQISEKDRQWQTEHEKILWDREREKREWEREREEKEREREEKERGLLLLPYSHSCFVLIVSVVLIVLASCYFYIKNYIIFCNAIYIFGSHFVMIKSI